MSTALVLTLGSVLVAGALGFALTRGRVAKPEQWGAVCMLIQLVAGNVFNRVIFLDRMPAMTATATSVACGLVIVVVATVIVRARASTDD